MSTEIHPSVVAMLADNVMANLAAAWANQFGMSLEITEAIIELGQGLVERDENDEVPDKQRDRIYTAVWARIEEFQADGKEQSKWFREFGVE